MKPSARLSSVGDQKVRAEVDTIFSGAKSMEKSCGAAATESRNGCHTACA